MSTAPEAKITDRPYPFEVKTALLQLAGLAIGTPRDVADVCVDFSPYVDQVSVRVFVGGYESNKNSTPQVADTIYMDGRTVSEVTERVAALIVKIETAIADGRKIKAKRLRDEAAELLKRAKEIEAATA